MVNLSILMFKRTFCWIDAGIGKKGTTGRWINTDKSTGVGNSIVCLGNYKQFSLVLLEHKSRGKDNLKMLED